MSRLRSAKELERLHAQALALTARIREVAARDKTKRDADEHRRRLIAGAAGLNHMAAEPDSEFASKLLGLINAHARSKSDRGLFKLSPLPKEPEASSAS